jgi:hypothetical protein
MSPKMSGDSSAARGVPNLANEVTRHHPGQHQAKFSDSNRLPVLFWGDYRETWAVSH